MESDSRSFSCASRGSQLSGSWWQKNVPFHRCLNMFAFSASARARHDAAFAALPKRSLIHASWFIAW